MIEFKPAIIDPKYYKKWNLRNNVFEQLYKDGKLLRETLYIQDIVAPKPEDRYRKVLKTQEALYDDWITKDKAQKKHLDKVWCILDRDGNEKQVFQKFQIPYLVGDIIYKLNNSYYSIETGEIYGDSYTDMVTENFIFIHDEWNKDLEKRGVIQINRKDGKYKLII